MESETIQVIAGFTSATIFASSKIPMLLKAFITKDLKSYSLGHMALSNTGNVVYWIYVVSLPLGPIWLLQSFFTIADVLMLLCKVKSLKSGRSELASSRLVTDTAVNVIRAHQPSSHQVQI